MLVSVRASRPSEYRSFLITHGVNGSRVRPVRSNVLPAGVRLSIMTAEAEEAVDVVPEQDVTVDVEGPQPLETLLRSPSRPMIRRLPSRPCHLRRRAPARRRCDDAGRTGA